MISSSGEDTSGSGERVVAISHDTDDSEAQAGLLVIEEDEPIAIVDRNGTKQRKGRKTKNTGHTNFLMLRRVVEVKRGQAEIALAEMGKVKLRVVRLKYLLDFAGYSPDTFAIVAVNFRRETSKRRVDIRTLGSGVNQEQARGLPVHFGGDEQSMSKTEYRSKVSLVRRDHAIIALRIWRKRRLRLQTEFSI